MTDHLLFCSQGLSTKRTLPDPSPHIYLPQARLRSISSAATSSRFRSRLVRWAGSSSHHFANEMIDSVEPALAREPKLTQYPRDCTANPISQSAYIASAPISSRISSRSGRVVSQPKGSASHCFFSPSFISNNKKPRFRPSYSLSGYVKAAFRMRYFSAFPHESFNVTVRLNTGAPGFASTRSATK